MFSLASKLLATIATPAFEKAYEKGCSIWDAKDELDKLRRTVQTIQAVLLDAERKQDSSASIKDWIERVRDVLYDADDLFDEVATDYVFKQQIIKGGKLLKKVQPFCSKLNPIISRNSIANKVKDIRKRLLEISTDMEGFKFVELVYDQPQPISSVRKGQESGSFVDFKEVIGRDEDKKTILELLLNDKSNNGEQDVSVIAIVGIGGMGKTTLAQLVYNDKEVEKSFEKRWFACISNTSDNKEIIGKIVQSVTEENCSNFTLSQLETKIRKAIQGERFLLVLDDVWDEDRASWLHRLSLLRGGAKGSKIIVTTRSLSVKSAVGALEAHNLEGLSENESWDLFKRIAFTLEQEKDSRWTNLGREIVKKCANVPLAIRSVASLLNNKATIKEWESLKDNELSKFELNGDLVMQTLKLSYDHLPSNLKTCFAYCSLFPKDHLFDSIDGLIYLWIAQGYIKPNHEMQTVEQAGYSDFMDLHRRSFFQSWENMHGFIGYKMHDLHHDLAQRVAGEEIIALTKPPSQFSKKAVRPRHLSVGHEVLTSWGSVAQMLNTSRLRSLVFFNEHFPQRTADQCLLLALDQQSTYGKCLRVLSLKMLRIQTVSSCVGELKHLRYLNLSLNSFESLPDSLTNLLNLLTLDLQGCHFLKGLPDSFRKLINLRHLRTTGCRELKHMPPGIGELTCLQNLSNFMVAKAIDKAVKRSDLDALDGLQLRGVLQIKFEDGIDNWDGDERWQLPVSLEQLEILKYPGRRIPHWSNHPSLLPNLACLAVIGGRKVKHLPPLRFLPNLEFLHLEGLDELEYIEEEEEEYDDNNSLFFPLLEQLEMHQLPKLKGWSRRKVAASPDLLLCFPLLSQLTIRFCEELMLLPLCPCVRKLEVHCVDGGLIQHLLPTLASAKICHIGNCHNLENWHDHLLASSVLEDLFIYRCDGLKSIEVEALPSLVSLQIKHCDRLKSLRIAHLNVLQSFIMLGCRELELWGLQQEKSVCVDWDSLPNLCLLEVDRVPSLEELPDCLRLRQALGQFQVNC